MSVVVTKLRRDPLDSHAVVVQIPLELLRHAEIEANAEVTLRVSGMSVILEAIEANTEWMEAYAEEFVESHRSLLRALVDPEWPAAQGQE